MLVSELIKRLQELPPDVLVNVSCPGWLDIEKVGMHTTAMGKPIVIIDVDM